MIRVFLLFLVSFFIGSNKNMPINSPKTIISTNNDTTLLDELRANYEKSSQLFAPEKVYAQLDKTLYQLGETVWFSVFVRNANTLEATKMSELVHVELYHPNGTKMKDLTLAVNNGMARGDILISPDWSGGVYTFKAFTVYQGNFDKKKEYIFTKKITVQKVVLPNLRMKLDFEKEAYGAGDKVKADLTLETLDDSPLRFQTLDFVVKIAGRSIFSKEGRTNLNGKMTIEFDLPNNLNSNDGLVNIMMPYLGLTESISRSIPIVLNNIDLQFLPESGHLVSDVSNNIAFKALNEFGEPADVSGIIYDKKGKEVQRFSSYHQGMGVVAFSPKKNEQYTAKITKPANIKQVYQLPVATTNELNVVQVVTQEKDFLKIKITGKRTKSLAFVAAAKGKVYHSTILRPSDENGITISTKNAPIGIMDLTVLSSDMQPIAERLVFVNPHQRLNIDISTNKKQYRPLEKVKMDISVRDHLGNPVSSQFSLAVVDDKVLSFSDDKQANILGYMLLDSELSGTVKEPNFYFEKAEKHPKKDQILALDLLMMTQGWRKYNWKKQSELKLADIKTIPETRTIEGTVKDINSKEIANISVSIPSLKRTTKTDENGYFKFESVDIEDGITVKVQNKKEPIYTVEVQNYDYLNINYVTENLKNILVARYKSSEGTVISGKIIDKKTGEGLIAASVTLFDVIRNVPLSGSSTDVDGNYKIPNIDAKAYRIQISYVGYYNEEHLIQVNNNEHIVINAGLEEGLAVQEVTIRAYRVPLILQDHTTRGRTITAEDIKNLPTRSIAGIVATTAGVTVTNNLDELSLRGRRNNQGLIYIDGVRVKPTPSSEQFHQYISSQKHRPINSRPLYILDKKRIPKNIVEDVMMALSPYSIKTFKVISPKDSYKKYGNDGIHGTYIIKSIKQKKGVLNYRMQLKNRVKNLKDFYEKNSNNYKERNTSIQNIINGIEFPQINIENTLKSIIAQQEFLIETEEKLEGLSTFLNKKINLDEKIERNFNVQKYLYAQQFSQGFYNGREFYTPKYESKKTVQPEARNDFRQTIYWNP
ncbi:MAG: carboxypeptidase-like regulatory domain-containing protein, partial [Saprospiraceae bacterium]